MNTAPFRFGLRVALFGFGLGLLLLCPDAVRAGVTLRLLAGPLAREAAQAQSDLRSTAGRIAYLGDSVVYWVAGEEPAGVGLAALLAAELKQEVVNLSMASHGQRMFAGELAYLRGQGVRPRAVLLPVNLRSFSPHWQHFPAWDHRRKADLVATEFPLARRLGFLFEGDIEADAKAARGRARVLVAGRDRGPLAELDAPPAGLPAPEVARARCLARYCAEVACSPELPWLRSNLEALRASTAVRVAYLTPVDVQFVGRTCAPDEAAAMHANLELLRATLRAAGIAWLDLSTALGREDFEHPGDDINEHLRESGRRRVARELAAVVRAELEREH
ncbi:MAG: hypothetical protein HZA54_08295 [Planctomycetes bacterium]|nr:hypothetical protein [Planctomycetota bacterium]